MHNHSAEETHVVIEGAAEVVVGDDRQRLEKDGVAVVPAMEFHEVANSAPPVIGDVLFYGRGAAAPQASPPLFRAAEVP